MDDKHQISKLVRTDKFQFSKFDDQNNFIAILNTRLPKVLLVRRAGLVIDIWNLPAP